MSRVVRWGGGLMAWALPMVALAADKIDVFTMSPGASGTQNYSVPLQVLILMTLLSVLPALLMMMTSFTRIIVVFAILRQAIGLQQTPSNQILLGLALFLTLFIMRPVFTEIHTKAVVPYQEDKLTAPQAIDVATKPLRNFMLKQTRQDDLALFMRLSGQPRVNALDQVPMTTVIPAFVTSELKTAFQIGFLLFIPFLIIDLVVASVLMTMGMMMLSPVIISLPFKLMLFVMVDGWSMVMGTLAASYGVGSG